MFKLFLAKILEILGLLDIIVFFKQELENGIRGQRGNKTLAHRADVFGPLLRKGFGVKWAMIKNTPLQGELKQQLCFPSLHNVGVTV